MEIRVAIFSDCEEIARLAAELGYPSTVDAIATRLGAVLKDKDQDIFVAKDEQPGIKGWIHVFLAQRLINEPFAEIGGLVVDGRYRSSGIGKALLQQAEHWAASRKLRILRIRSNAIRVEAHRFYNRMGYKIDKTQTVFIKHLDNN